MEHLSHDDDLFPSCAVIPSDEAFETYETFSWWISGFCTILIACYGFIANSASACILLQTASKTSPNVTHKYVLVHAIFDCLFLICALSEGLQIVKTSEVHLVISETLVYQCKYIFLYCSIGIKFVVMHHHYKEWSSPEPFSHKNWRYIFIQAGIIVVTSSTLAIPMFFEVQVVEFDHTWDGGLNITSFEDERDDSFKVSIVRPTTLRFNYSYIMGYKCITVTLLPILILIALNYKLYKTLLKHEHAIDISEQIELQSNFYIKREDANEGSKETLGITMMTVAFIVCYFPKLALLGYELTNTEWLEEHYDQCLVPSFLFYGKCLHNGMLIINCSMSSCIYLIAKWKHSVIL